VFVSPVIAVFALLVYAAKAQEVASAAADREDATLEQRRLRREAAATLLTTGVPLACRLDAGSLSCALEDAAFVYLAPRTLERTQCVTSGIRDQRVLDWALERVRDVLRAEGIHVHALHGRRKSLLGVWRNIRRSRLSDRRTPPELLDTLGLRVIVADADDCDDDGGTGDTGNTNRRGVEGCYGAMQAVQATFRCVTSESSSKDYIRRSRKPNGYQSLHCTFRLRADALGLPPTPGDGAEPQPAVIPLEVQVRSISMHLHACFGPSSHSAYKRDKYAGALAPVGRTHDEGGSTVVNDANTVQKKLNGDALRRFCV